MSTQAQNRRQSQRDATGKYTSYTPEDSGASLTGPEGHAGSLSPVTPENAAKPGTPRPVSADAQGFEASLSEHLGDQAQATVHVDDRGQKSYVLGEGEVSISEVSGHDIELGGGGTHRAPDRIVVQDHTGAEPATVFSGQDEATMNSYTAARAVEHQQSIQDGRSSGSESRQADMYPARDGLPASYGFDLRTRGMFSQEMARTLTERFDDEHTEVTAYDSGGGNEIIGVFGTHPDTGNGYEVLVASQYGGSLDEECWAVGADYEEHGEWGHSDLDELYESDANSSFSDVADAVNASLVRSHLRAGRGGAEPADA